MKYWTIPILMVSLAQAACSGGGTGADENMLINDPTSPDTGGQNTLGEPFAASSLMNNGGIGPEPNFWNCALRQNSATVSLETSYQFFTDLSGVSFLGANSITFSWDIAGVDSGYIDLTNDSGAIPIERWFITMRSPTTFSAAIAYRQSLSDFSDTSVITTNANIDCVLYTQEGAVNPDDANLLDQFNDGSGGENGDITSIAQSIINPDSEFGLERQLWQCIAFDDSFDLLLGFYPNGIGGVYNTRNGQLEGSQSTYLVTELDGIGSVTVDAVLNNQVDQLQLSDVIFERNSQFEARLKSSVSNIDALISCNTISTAELPV